MIDNKKNVICACRIHNSVIFHGFMIVLIVACKVALIGTGLRKNSNVSMDTKRWKYSTEKGLTVAGKQKSNEDQVEWEKKIIWSELRIFIKQHVLIMQQFHKMKKALRLSRYFFPVLMIVCFPHWFLNGISFSFWVVWQYRLHFFWALSNVS